MKVLVVVAAFVALWSSNVIPNEAVLASRNKDNNQYWPQNSPNDQHIQAIGNDNHIEHYIFNTNIVVHELNKNGKDINRIVRTACRATQGCNVFVVDWSTVVANSANTTAARDLHLLGPNEQHIVATGNGNHVKNYIFNTNIVVHELNTNEEDINRIVRTACRATQGCNVFVVDRSTAANSANTTAARDLPLLGPNKQHILVTGNDNHVENYICNTNIVATQGCNVFVVDWSTVANSANTTAARDLHLLGQNNQNLNAIGNNNKVSNNIFNTNIAVHDLNINEEDINRIVRTACRATQGKVFVVDRSTAANSANTTAARDLHLRWFGHKSG